MRVGDFLTNPPEFRRFDLRGIAMGKGAYVTIQNESTQALTLSYSNLNCMFQNGDEGSNFGPISGAVKPGASRPAGGAQYIEAKASGSCAFETSTFNMNIQCPGGTLTLNFSESGNTWRVDNAHVVAAGLQASTAIQSGDQYHINVVVADHQWSAQSWMADLASTIGNRPLCQIALPGTHDSGTYDITAVSTIAPEQDLSQWVNAVYALGLSGLVAAEVIAGWSKTQPVSIGQQLEAGIRYFDLRVVLSGSDYWVCHGMYSCKIDDVINDVKNFVDQHPKEIVILDFNHLYQMSGKALNQSLIQKMTAAFGNKMAPNSLGPTVTPNSLWDQGYQIIVLYADADTVTAYNQLWPQGAISSPWPETTDMQTLQSKLNNNIDERSLSQLFVLQGILTPDGGMIGKGLLPGYPGSIKSLANEVTPTVCQWLQQWASRPINIVIVDWFNCVGTQYVDLVVNINLTRR